MKEKCRTCDAPAHPVYGDRCEDCWNDGMPTNTHPIAAALGYAEAMARPTPLWARSDAHRVIRSSKSLT